MRITSPCSSTRPTVRHRPKRFLITACWSLAKLGLPRGARGVTRKRVAERRDCGVNMSLAGGFAHCCFCRCWYSAPIPFGPHPPDRPGSHIKSSILFRCRWNRLDHWDSCGQLDMWWCHVARHPPTWMISCCCQILMAQWVVFFRCKF